MELGLGLLGGLLIICGVSWGIALISTGHFYGLFKAAGENPIFAIAVIVGIICVVVGLLTGNHSAEGSLKLFEDGVGWVLTIIGSLLIIGFLVAAVAMPIKAASEKSAKRGGAADAPGPESSASGPHA